MPRPAQGRRRDATRAGRRRRHELRRNALARSARSSASMGCLRGVASLIALVPLALDPVLRRRAGRAALSTWPSSRSCRAGRRDRRRHGQRASSGRSILIGLGALVAIPIGMLAGIYVAEYRGADALVRRPLRRRHAQRRAVDRDRRLRLRRSSCCRSSASSRSPGGVALGIMMIPIITRTTEELLRLVPARCARARWRSAPRARGRLHRRVAAALPGHHHGHRARARAHRRRDGAAAVHGVQQPVLDARASTSRSRR